ncbi:MAG: polysaccharide biosynthesis/export family protein [Candidatus Thiosymbion ectosymbiont of Robbea hypermnestra]|nr:polysaccharide biosynthesis/export family protein [Candidatus Thiosymbion ectosymbiont of Robbea hypermnestra]
MNLTRMRSCRFLLAFFAVLLVYGCSSPGVITLSDGGRAVPIVDGPPPNPGRDIVYRIRPYDLLEIRVFQADELSGNERVSGDGKIILPLIGGVSIVGLTPREAERKLAHVLRRAYLQDPQVDLFVAEYADQEITVSGAVHKPDVFPIKGRTSLMQAIAQAGGLERLAKEDEIIVFRGQGTPQARIYIVDFDAVRNGSLPDPVLVANDRILVPESAGAFFFKEVMDTLRGFVSLIPLATL